MFMEFTEWLYKELDKRGWSQYDLAKMVGVTQAHINHILRNRRNPGNDFLEGVARAFRMPKEEIFRIAGILPKKPENDFDFTEYAYKYKLLTEENKTFINDMIGIMLDKQEEK